MQRRRAFVNCPLFVRPGFWYLLYAESIFMFLCGTGKILLFIC